MIPKMSTETYNTVTVVLWSITLVAGLATVTVYIFQLKAMHAGIKAQNLAWLVQYLQSPEVRSARHVVMTQLWGNRPPREWGSEQREAASTACAAYGVAAVFIELKRVDKEVIVNNWGPSIGKIGRICDRYIADQRKEMGDEYWRSLVGLIEEVQEKYSKAGTPSI